MPHRGCERGLKVTELGRNSYADEGGTVETGTGLSIDLRGVPYVPEKMRDQVVVNGLRAEGSRISDSKD